ncbi:MAG: RNA-guided pseudouridylation complex pseudouridine synthase subunit Cbf5 [Candidatus Micrarchaeia archaeon]
MLQKISEPTDPAYGKPPEQRSMAELLELGVVVVDKPPGPSSHEVSVWVKNLLGARRTGHAGTLDPNVSGVLPVALNRATRVLGLLLKEEKEYVGIIRFHRRVSEQEVRQAFARFIGEIVQVPPVKSAVRRVPRKRKVYYLAVTELFPTEALFTARVEAGTYIRKLCHDIGKQLGGANLLELRRTRAGGLGEELAVALPTLADAAWLWKEKGDESALRSIVLPVEKVVTLPRMLIRDSAIEAVCSGAPLHVPGIVGVDENVVAGTRVALFSQKGELVAVAQATMSAHEMLRAEKGTAAKTLRVVMKKGTYPKGW